ncbi:MAG: OmpA/MotB family protein [Planctomycetota bacterium]|jgi:chemotaxis protein MotB
MGQRIGLLACLVGVVAAGCGAGVATSPVSGELAALRRQAGDIRTEISSAEKRLRALATEAVASEAETRDLKAELESIGVTVTPRGASISVGLADRLLFNAGQVLIHDRAREKLLAVGKALKKRFPDRLISIEGHSDSRPPDKMAAYYPTNWELSTARAMSVLRCLADDVGIAPERICAAGFADCRPLAQEDSDDARAANRRVEIVVQPPLGTTRVTAAFEE